jgi:type IV secretion system protein VirD4
MFSLPRGVGASVDVSLASAAWALPKAVERLAYREGSAALFVGAIPALENWPLLQEIFMRGGNWVEAVESNHLPPLRRAELVKRLDGLWRSALVADCVPLGLDDDRHFVTIAGSRSGKGTSAIIPNLCLYPGSVVCLDPKGENATKTAARRGAGTSRCEGLGQEVYVLDPFGVADVPDSLRAGLNPLALLDPASPLVVDDAAMLAEGLVTGSGDSRDAHWDESARNFIKGLILHLVTTHHHPTLFTLRRFLTQGDKDGWENACLAVAEDAERSRAFIKDNPSPFPFLLNDMRYSEAFAGVVAGAAETLASCGDNERGSILSTARRNTAFLDTLDSRFVNTLEGRGRGFLPDVVKKAPQGASVYLCLPAERMGTHGRWLRLMIGLLLEWAYRDLAYPACNAPVLFLLDEFHSLGYMSMIEKAAGYAAGFGIKLWAVLQDIQQLKALYPQSWQTFLANAGAVQVFGVSDQETTAYVSKALGEVELVKHVKNRSENYQSSESSPSPHQKASGVFGGKGFSLSGAIASTLPDKSHTEGRSVSEAVSQQIQIVPLLRPDEVAIQFARETGAALLLVKGQKPVWCLRMEYFNAPWFKGLYLPSPTEDWGEDLKPAFGQRSPDTLKAVAVDMARFSF